MTDRPRTVLAMAEGMDAYAFDRALRARLEEVAEVLDPAPLTTLDDDRARSLLAEAEVLLTHWGSPRVDGAALDAAPMLRLVAHGAGTVKGHVSRAVLERGVVVTSAAWANAEPVAQFTLATILFAAKDVFGARERGRPGVDRAVLPDRRSSLGLPGRRVGVIGASSVGRRVMDLLRAFPVEVLLADPYLDEHAAAELGARLVTLDELVATADVVTIHAPDLPETHHLLDAGRLAALQDGATLVNTARGALVDHDALVAELRRGRITAVLDVTDPEPLPRDHPLRSLDNVFLTPHLAGSVGSEVPAMTALAVEEVERLAAGLPPRHPVDLAAWDRLA